MPGLGGTPSGSAFRAPIKLRKPALSGGVNTGNYDQIYAVDFKKITLTSAQLKTMFTTPVALLGAPTPPGNAAIVTRAILNYKYGSAQYTGGGAITIGYKTTAAIAAAATVAATFLTSPTANQVIEVAGALATNLSADVLNQPLYITNATQVFAAGDGTVDLWLMYQRIPLV